jgi:hypothetical protein
MISVCRSSGARNDFAEFACRIRTRRTPYAPRFRSRPSLFLTSQFAIACAFGGASQERA